MNKDAKITGEWMIFRKDWDDGGKSYSISIMSKDREGNKKYAYMPVLFRKGVEIANKTRINITESWLTVIGEKAGWFISEYDSAEETDGFQEVYDSIPF